MLRERVRTGGAIQLLWGRHFLPVCGYGQQGIRAAFQRGRDSLLQKATKEMKKRKES